MSNTSKNLEIARHSLAHLMAASVLELWPEARFGVGPTVENGFYYDIEIPGYSLKEMDLKKIEKTMKKKIQANLPFERKEISIDESISLFESKQQPYKVELLKDLKQKGTTRLDNTEVEILPAGSSQVSVYETGTFVDLCRGPHVNTTSDLKPYAFTLHKLAGAYWRGSEANPMLTRIYGLAFASQKELDEYSELLKEAEKRDHRKLGKELNLFTFSNLVGKGLPLWTHYGATIRRELENFVIEEELKRGYLHVVTPELAKVDLYRTSGHYPYYKDTMYPPMEIDDEELILRPMTCPHHFMLYTDQKRSYRELPMRIAELARLYRYEKSGELTGMIRVRSFCLADAHIICTPEQVKDEIKRVIELIEYVTGKLGLKKGEDVTYRLSLGDRQNEKKYYKNDAGWDQAEKVLRETLTEIKAPFTESEDDAAFYGPKIDIQMKNVLGKEDTAFTVQYDMCMPERFDLTYIDDQGKEQRPIVIHRSSIGAIERTFGFLIERYAGAFPLWLAPVQISIISVGAEHRDYCDKLGQEFREQKLRVEVDNANETVGNKIRKATNMKIPYMLVIGDKEMNSENLTVRVRGQEKLLEIKQEEFIDKLKQEIENKTIQ